MWKHFPLATKMTSPLGKCQGVRQKLRKGVVNTSFELSLRTFHDNRKYRNTIIVCQQSIRNRMAEWFQNNYHLPNCLSGRNSPRYRDCFAFKISIQNNNTWKISIKSMFVVLYRALFTFKAFFSSPYHSTKWSTLGDTYV